MTSKYEEPAKKYLSIINEKLGLNLALGGESGQDGIKDPILGGYVGHLFPNMSMLYSAIFTAEQIIGLPKRIQDKKEHDLEIKAHYWETIGKPLYKKYGELKE